ncbi:hypothetical protein RHOFW104R8_05660 [Rhodanobacter sp. FW104-R8]|nr:hypothetical protein RHOFW104R8_05660 [Rhodanobacter sp. FW104-R8]KZC27763.1 hypothetical protein RhoFW510T8_14690 [Rhodanobacter sp. FW510-T8]KZC29473.1 hypothetical protein RhoFW510R10_05675 [Rhodanobacter sp. FW510-R10]
MSLVERAGEGAKHRRASTRPPLLLSAVAQDLLAQLSQRILQSGARAFQRFPHNVAVCKPFAHTGKVDYPYRLGTISVPVMIG